MSAIEKIRDGIAVAWNGKRMTRSIVSEDDFNAALAEAWAAGYEASDYEAYHMSTHGRTDNPYEENR